MGRLADQAPNPVCLFSSMRTQSPGLGGDPKQRQVSVISEFLTGVLQL